MTEGKQWYLITSVTRGGPHIPPRYDTWTTTRGPVEYAIENPGINIVHCTEITEDEAKRFIKSKTSHDKEERELRGGALI